jgi:excisionase family DNA binding protein
MPQYQETAHEEPRASSLPCAYILVIPNVEGPVLDTLQKLLATLVAHDPIVLPIDPKKPSLEVVDSWLEHSAAAEYLGVGRSTLYRYSEHQEIESRKFCGRLQYRLSSLDEFKARHVRPSHHSENHKGIIAPAPTPASQRSAIGTVSKK